MKLRNLKASFILKDKVSSLPKKKNYSFKQDTFTFNIYHHAPYLINVTGVKTFERLKLARQIIEKKLKQPLLKVRIDNTFYSQKNYRNVDLIKVHEFMQHHDTFSVDYHVELFAGMYFHPKKVNYPTILFFRTGSYSMLGGKQWKILKDCEKFVKTLIEMFDRKKNDASLTC